MEKGSALIANGGKVVEGLRALDQMFVHGMRLVPSQDPVVHALQQENQAMRVALCALLVEAGGDVSFKIPKTFAFDVLVRDGDVIVRRA